ncbi:MAG: alpha/beta hydrolase [Acidobacteriota bacterium]
MSQAPKRSTQTTRRLFLQQSSTLAGGLAASTLVPGCGAPPADEEVAADSPAPFSRNGVTAAPGLPTPTMIDTNGVSLAVYDQGEGTPIVFCHGFPELAYSWRHQIQAVSEAGYRAIAPDQRGYGLSDRPEGFENYTLGHLCADLDGVLDALEIEKAVFCGHDWGGGVVWMMPRVFPERVAGVVGVNTPAMHPMVQREPNPLIVQSENYYVATFQPPGVADEKLAADVRRSFEMMLRKDGIWDREAFAALPEDSAERQVDLLRMLEEGNFAGELLLTEDELAVFVDTYEATGFTGGLNWYRAAAQTPPNLQVEDWNIDVPCLYIGAEDDVILPPESADGMDTYIADLETYTVADCGHWTQQEKPEEVNRVLIDWLGRKIA